MKTIEYSVWCGMRQRCLNRRTPAYKNYGGRGIKICNRWKDFSNFLEDMGNRPSLDYTIDRINNDGNYEQSNCQWILRSLNSSKTRNTLRKNCINGHPFSGRNLIIRKSNRKGCRECKNAWDRKNGREIQTKANALGLSFRKYEALRRAQEIGK